MLFFRNNWDDYPQSLEKNVRLKPGNGSNVQPQMSHLRQSVDNSPQGFLDIVMIYFIDLYCVLLYKPAAENSHISLSLYVFIYI